MLILYYRYGTNMHTYVFEHDDSESAIKNSLKLLRDIAKEVLKGRGPYRFILKSTKSENNIIFCQSLALMYNRYIKIPYLLL